MDPRLQAIADRWDKTERRIKEIELLSKEVRIPAVNELRYAGRQLVDAFIALRNGGLSAEILERKIYEHFIVAEQYIRNADHDVSDATVDYLKTRVERGASLYGMKNINYRFGYFSELRDRLAVCEQLIIAARADRTLRDRNYEEIYENHLTRLVPLFMDYRKSEPDIIFDSLITERKYKVSKAFNVIAGLASIIGVGLAVLSWTVPWNDVKLFTCAKLSTLCPAEKAH